MMKSHQMTFRTIPIHGRSAPNKCGHYEALIHGFGEVGGACRKATVDDIDVLFKLLQDLAEYHECPDELHTTPKLLRRAMERGIVGAFLLELKGTAIGMVIFSFAYSTWVGDYVKMEDLFVLQEYRGGGYGKLLWRAIAQMPVEDASTDGGWLIYKMCPEGIRKLATSQ